MAQLIQPTARAATATVATAASQVNSLSTVASQTNQVARQVSLGNAAAALSKPIGQAKVLASTMQDRFAQLGSSIQGLPLAEQVDALLAWLTKEFEETWNDFSTAFGELTPEWFKFSVRAMATGVVTVGIQFTKGAGILVIDPQFWQKVQTHFIRLVEKIDYRKLFTQEELVRIFQANLRLQTRFIA